MPPVVISIGAQELSGQLYQNRLVATVEIRREAGFLRFELLSIARACVLRLARWNVVWQFLSLCWNASRADR